MAEIIQKISDEHRKLVIKVQPPVRAPTNWLTRLCNNLAYLFCCTRPQPDDEQVKPVPEQQIEEPDPLGFANDNGFGKIPQDTAEARMNAMIAERNRQDNLYFPQTDEAREKAKISFAEFNRTRNEETAAQFKQMQQEKGY
jgi:hypothetical protein